MTGIRYHVRHDTDYHYDQPVSESRQLVRLSPRDLPRQRVIAHELEVLPAPSRTDFMVDPFGNQVAVLHLEQDHEALRIRAESWVELQPRPPLAVHASPPWQQVRESLGYQAGRGFDEERLEAVRYLFESTHVRVKRDFADYARPCFGATTPLLAGVTALMGRIHEDFTFDPEATTVSTPVTEVFEKRRGVCQDFAHLMLSCLRSLGLPARYMSGYLLTRPPPGKPRLIGADATHAWVAVHCPGLGWVEFDPTNDLLPDLEHITLGWGRDFTDISPLRGVILGGGLHEPEIAVTVVPEAEFSAVYGDLPDPEAPDLIAGTAPASRRPPAVPHIA